MPECKCGTVSKPVPCPECGKAFVVVDAAALRVLVKEASDIATNLQTIPGFVSTGNRLSFVAAPFRVAEKEAQDGSV